MDKNAERKDVIAGNLEGMFIHLHAIKKLSCLLSDEDDMTGKAIEVLADYVAQAAHDCLGTSQNVMEDGKC